MACKVNLSSPLLPSINKGSFNPTFYLYDFFLSLSVTQNVKWRFVPPRSASVVLGLYYVHCNAEEW